MNRSIESLKAFVAMSDRPSAWTPTAGVIVVGAGKGGVGTSVLAAMMGVAAAREGERVLLVDADESMGSLHLMLGLPDATVGAEALRGGEVTAEELLVPVMPGLDLFPGGSEPRAEGTSVERRVLLRRVASLFSHYSVVIIDAGSKVDSVMAACRSGAERLLCVTAPDRIAVAASYALLKTSRARFPSLPVELLVNRVDEKVARSVYSTVRSAADHFLAVNITYGGSIPDDGSLLELLESGTSLSEASHDSVATSAIASLIARVLSEGRAASSALAPVIPLEPRHRG